ncbi:uncharacterized protein A4U43_C06F14310 [Asparagus officinalis]|uniref:Uncharacterized protein n=1 Tax=Asparagus officinalis TaxID=4686 RepID=A0A5P1EQA8_ASPOF|nr:uncharacterized protein A4U43_C06F14310 [Asparagus officinalis]
MVGLIEGRGEGEGGEDLESGSGEFRGRAQELSRGWLELRLGATMAGGDGEKEEGGGALGGDGAGLALEMEDVELLGVGWRSCGFKERGLTVVWGLGGRSSRVVKRR